MSIPYSVAVAAVTKKAGINEFSQDCIDNERIKACIEKIDVQVDSSLTAIAPTKRAAIAEIETINGSFYSERVDYPKGEPENPMSFKDVEDKFTMLAQYYGKTTDEIKTIINIVWNIEEDISRLFALI